MRKMKLKSIVLMAVMMISLLAGSVTVFAEETEAVGMTEKDTAGNALVADLSVDGESYERDLYWFGNEMSMSNVEMKGDLISAGYAIFVNGADIGGSVRTASYNADFSDVTVENNMTVTGNSLSFDETTIAKGIYAMGNDITFNGECDALNAAGNIIILNGTVNGDAIIDCSQLTIGPKAVVTGTLKVTAADETTIPESAQISNYEYIPIPDIDEEEIEDSEAVSGVAEFVGKLINRVYWIPAMIVVALFFCLLIPGALDGSGQMLLKKPVAMPLTGLISICALPIALIIICVTFIGLPLAGLITLLMLPMLIFAVPFVGSSAARIIFPKMNVWLSSIIGTAVLTLALAIPFVGGLVKFLCIIYVLGYFVQKCYEQMQTLGKKPAVTEENTQA